MRRALGLVFVVMGCGETVEIVQGSPNDGGVGVARRDGSIKADAGADPFDAATDASGEDAGEPDAGTLLGRACNPDTPTVGCEAFTHPAYNGSEPGICFTSVSPMFGRCTFNCGRDTAPGDIDANKANLCEVFGGQCKPWKQGGLPICFAP
jgi:hypothetical protein